METTYRFKLIENFISVWKKFTPNFLKHGH